MKLYQIKQQGFSNVQLGKSLTFQRFQMNTSKVADRNQMGGNCEDCENWEEEMYWSKFKVVHFFTVITKYSRFHLKFPRKLVRKCLVNELSKIRNVTLKGPSGRTWSVELMRCSDYGDEEFYLRKGWELFVKEHNLKENDVLLFRYNLGSSVFDVLMFADENLREKRRLDSVKNRNSESFRRNKGCSKRRRIVDRGHSLEFKGCCNGSKALNEKKRVEREPSVEIFEPKRAHLRTVPISHDDEEEVYGRISSHPGFGKSKALVLAKRREGCNGSKALNEKKRVKREPSIEIFEPKRVHHRKVSDDDEEEVYGRISCHPGFSNPAPDCKGKALVPIKRQEDKQVIPLAVVLKKRTFTEKSKHVPFADAVREGSRRGAPHFVVLMKASHVLKNCFMTIPMASARKYLPRGAEDVSLRMNDKIWSVKLRQIGASIGFFGSGWEDFTRRNNLNAGDVCLFETTCPPASSSRSKDPVIFTVSVFRNLEDA